MQSLEAPARNKANYLAAKTAFNNRDLDGCMAYYAADHQMRSRDVGPGREHIRAFLAAFHEAWGELKIVVEHAVAEDDWVMGHCVSTGIHSTTVMGIAPTQRRITAGFWDQHRFNKNGLIVESWNIIDGATILRQLRGTTVRRE